MTNSREIAICSEVEIHRPAAVVWELIADYSADPAWRRGVSSMQPTPAGMVQVGTSTVEMIRLAGSTYRNLGEVIEVQPGREFSWRTTGGADANGSRSVLPTGPSSCVTRLELRVRPHGPQRVIAPVLALLLRRNLRGDGLRLRALAERGASGNPARNRATARALTDPAHRRFPAARDLPR